MTADINVILQLLQRQMVPVPPAYSAVSPSPHPPHPTALYSPGEPTTHSVPPMQPVHIDNTALPLQVLCLYIRTVIKSADLLAFIFLIIKGN